MYTHCTMTVDDLKGPRHQFSSKLSNGFFLFVISRMVKMGILNDSSIFECQIKSYKHDTEFEILCFVNKVQVLFLLLMC